MRNTKKNRRFELDTDEPKPYVYGLVGQVPATSPSPPPMEEAVPHSRATSLTSLVHPGARGGTGRLASASYGHTSPNLQSSESSSPLLQMTQTQERQVTLPPSHVLPNAAIVSDANFPGTRVSRAGSPISLTEAIAGQQTLLRLVNDEPPSPASSTSSQQQLPKPSQGLPPHVSVLYNTAEPPA